MYRKIVHFGHFMTLRNDYTVVKTLKIIQQRPIDRSTYCNVALLLVSVLFKNYGPCFHCQYEVT